MKKMKRWISHGNALECNILRKIDIEKIVPGGDGLARADGKVIFIPLVIPGERVDVSITEDKKKFRRGTCTKVVDPSPHRVAPVCPHYGICGGCNFQHMAYDYQVQVKKEIVKDLFKKFSQVDLPEKFLFVPSAPFAYRHRIQLHSDGVNTGFKMRGSDSIVEIQSCPLLIDSLNDYIKNMPSESFSGRKLLFGNGKDVYEDGDNREIQYDLLGKTLFFKADLFFQSNRHLLPELIKYVTENQEGREALDLYCGTGLFSVFLKHRFEKITAIEINPETEEYYHKNMRGEEYSYYALSLEKWIRKGYHKKHKDLDLVIVDPPRTGLSESVRSFLINLKVKKLIYVSCDPVTQARDTKVLIDNGYIIEDMRGFDFYPHSNHMENVVKFTRK